MGDFEKKLVIMSGKAGRGSVLCERNGLGCFVTLNVFSLPDLTAGEYALGIKTDGGVFRREVGSLGRIKLRFEVPNGEYSAGHFVLFRTYDEEVVMYGTLSPRKMWEGNLMDGLRRKTVDEKTANIGKAEAQTQEFRYSERKIEDYFLSIDPSKYRDGALADSDYYERYRREHSYYDEPPRPSDSEREYLDRRFRSPFERDSGAVGRAAERENESLGSSAQDAVRVSAPVREKPAEKESEPLSVKKASEYKASDAVAAVKTEAGFYASVKPRIEGLFERCERYEPLESTLPGTKWVKVDYDGTGRYYVVGLVGSAPDFVAYGVPGKYGERPAALEGADFVPLSDRSRGDGFWVLFQSADTGKEIAKKFS